VFKLCSREVSTSITKFVFFKTIGLLVPQPGSSAGIATGYGMDSRGIETRWGRDFPHLSRPALKPTQPPVQLVTSALEGGGWSAPRPGRFTPGKDQVPIVQEAGWTPGPVWTCAKNLAPTGIRSPDRPTRSQSLYRVSYRAHNFAWVLTVNTRTNLSRGTAGHLPELPANKWHWYVTRIMGNWCQ
jgi:hypothetical protein